MALVATGMKIGRWTISTVLCTVGRKAADRQDVDFHVMFDSLISKELLNRASRATQGKIGVV